MCKGRQEDPPSTSLRPFRAREICAAADHQRQESIQVGLFESSGWLGQLVVSPRWATKAQDLSYLLVIILVAVYCLPFTKNIILGMVVSHIYMYYLLSATSAVSQRAWLASQRSWVRTRPQPNAYCVPSFPAVGDLKWSKVLSFALFTQKMLKSRTADTRIPNRWGQRC